ncbi:MAG: hypothetical protein HKM89_13115 [Gemmatimonadales bacterium]|nr:hypothetical protein [Gemmatimonadales bacterium]
MPSRTLAGPVALVCMLGMTLPVGCATSDGTGNTVTVRDSAGITIVESTEPAWAEGTGWRVGDVPSVEIGGLPDDPRYDLLRVGAAFRLADGRLVVANAGSQELKFYDAAGAHLLDAGGEGQGPGEFTGLGLLAVQAGDTLLAFDFRQRRLSRFDPDGTFQDVFSFAGNDQGSVTMVDAFDDGTILSRTRRQFSAGSLPSGLRRDSALYFIHQLPITQFDTVGLMADTESFVKAAEGAMTVRRLAFGKRTTVVAHGEHIYSGTGDSYQIRVLDKSGAPRTIIRRAHEALALSPDQIEAHKESERDEIASQGTPPRFKAMFEAMLEEMPYPATHPAYSEFTLDRAGYLWVQGFEFPDDNIHRYQVFDITGQWLGAVEMPEGLEPTDIGPDYVLGIWRDEDEIEYVRLYPLVKQ